MADQCGEQHYVLSIADFRLIPGAKRGTRFAAISMALPLRGFRTSRALRCRMPNVPNPEMVTRSPRARLARIPSRSASSARVACARVSRASNAIFPTRSLFVTTREVISVPEVGVNRQENTEMLRTAQECYTADSDGEPHDARHSPNHRIG